jgi:hypothetical protein
MDLSKLKQRLSALQNPKGQKKEQSQDLWRPAVGKHQIRIVPSAYTKENPFKELYVHYGINNKTMMSPTSYGDRDPIVEFAQQLRKTSDWQSAKKLEPRMRVFVPIVVRGEEDKGVRLWEFGKQTYMEILKFFEDDDIGDFTDPVEGRDLIVETLDKETTGLMYNTSKVRISVKVSQLSNDAEKVKVWLEKQPDPMSIFKRWTYDEMKDALAAHLNPEEEIKQTVDHVEEKEEVKEAPKSFALSTPKKTTEDFDDLFKLDLPF